MECITELVHMDVTRCRIESQFSLEQDCNLSDTKPDINTIHLYDGFVKIEELRPTDETLIIKGKLHYRILYTCEEHFGALHCFSGKIPFEESIRTEGLLPGDNPRVWIEPESLHISAVNSRKINLRALIFVSGVVCDIKDAPLCTDLSGGENEIELHHEKCNLLNLTVMKKDICRIREDVKLPAGLPDFKEILWEQTHVGSLEFRPMENSLDIRGEVSLTCLYLSVSDTVETMDNTVSFHTTLECNACREGLVSHITYALSQKDFDILPDVDGNERVLGIDLVLDLNILLYEDTPFPLIDDLYGVHCKAEPVFSTYPAKQLLVKTSGRMCWEKEISLNRSENILQVKCAKAELMPEKCTPGTDAIEISGTLSLHILCVTEDDRYPYRTEKTEIPFRYSVSTGELPKDALYEMSANLESCRLSFATTDSITVKCNALFDVFAFTQKEVETLSKVTTTPYAREFYSSLAGISLYYIKEKDTLWEIGKDSLTSLAKIRECNALTEDTLTPGQKLLIMR